MEFVIPKGDLVRELQTVTGIVEKRSTLPILANLLLEASAGKIQMGASDLEVTVRGSVAAEVKKEGGVTLPAAKLHEIARSLPDSAVQFKLLERNQVAISCDRVRYKIAGQPKDEFPKFPEVEISKGIKLPGSAVREMIQRVAFAITTEDPRYSLHGALFVLAQGKITLVATDGYRLSYVARSAPASAKDGEIRVIVPRKALSEVSKLAEGLADGDTVTFGRSGNHVFFLVGGHTLTSTVPEGAFPKYEEVMPKASDTELVLPTGEFADAVRRVSLLASERMGKTIRFRLSKGQVELSTAAEVGEAQEELPVDYAGDEKIVGFNGRYLQEFLSVVGTSSVKVLLDPRRPGDDDDAKKRRAGDRPAEFRPEPAGDMEYRYIVMPRDL